MKYDPEQVAKLISEDLKTNNGVITEEGLPGMRPGVVPAVRRPAPSQKPEPVKPGHVKARVVSASAPATPEGAGGVAQSKPKIGIEQSVQPATEAAGSPTPQNAPVVNVGKVGGGPGGAPLPAQPAADTVPVSKKLLMNLIRASRYAPAQQDELLKRFGLQ